jgi:hypothetical protein
MSPGYSGTSLPKKLGIKPSMTIVTLGAPKDYRAWLGDLPEGARLTSRATQPLEAAHVFVTKRVDLQKHLSRFRRELTASGFIWISWPKKSSGVETDITEDTIRDVALPLGFVDVKVCAVSDVWSGLKLVIRKSDR